MSENKLNQRFENFRSQLKKMHIPPKVIFVLVGVASTIWFLIRVVPKPSRASYPCMRVAAPFMSSLVIYLIGITGSAFFYKRALNAFKTNRFVMLMLFIPAILVFLSLSILDTPKTSLAGTLPPAMVEASHPTAPIGVAKGINPGRVIWVYNSDATNENLTNNSGDYWFEDKNVDEAEIDKLLSEGLKSLTGETSVSSSWNALFKYFNVEHGKGNVGYVSGEKIFIKVNFTNSCCSNTDHRMDATPQTMVSLLKSLIEDAGIPQSAITIGDPFRDFKDFHIAKCHDIYPDVHYIGPNASSPVEQTQATSDDILKFSDGQETARIAQAYVDADYFINMPSLKSHNSGGITIAAKNHQGSILAVGDDVNNQSAFFMHYALPDQNSGSGKYRHLVDYMGHEQLGGKNLLILVDAIWGGDNWEGNIFKWQMPPFNNDYPSSLILSQDQVAVEAVCYDILLEEYRNPPNGGDYPYLDGTNDFLWQAASEDYWPAGITYDPEGDGTKIGSLGVYEHWNNATDRKYSRNLGTGNGIELLEFSTKNIEYPNTLTMANSDIPSDQVNVIYVDSLFTVWVGTDFGLSRMDIDGWKNYDTILLNNKVNDIAYERTAYGKELWIATDSGLTVSAYNDLDGVTGATTYVPDNSGIGGHIVTSVDVDVNHNRWIGTDVSLSVFRGNMWGDTASWSDVDGEAFNFADNPITDIKPYLFDSVTFVATKGKGIARVNYDYIDGFSGASSYGQPWASIASNNVSSIDVDEEIQWFGTDLGVSKHSSPYTKSDWTTFDMGFGLINNDINTVHIDKLKNTWLGTSTGISILTNDGGVYELTTDEGLVNNHVNHISGDINGNIWVATSGGIQWFEQLAGEQVVLGIPELLTPVDFDTITNANIFLSWNEVSGAETYNLEISSDADFTDILIEETGLNVNNYTITSLDFDSEYFWRASASNSDLDGAWSVANFFITGEEEVNSSNIAALNAEVRLFPNPASNEIHLVIHPNISQSINVKILDIKGKLIEVPVQTYIESSGQVVDVNISDKSKYPTGIYIVKIEGETFNHVMKLNIK